MNAQGTGRENDSTSLQEKLLLDIHWSKRMKCFFHEPCLGEGRMDTMSYSYLLLPVVQISYVKFKNTKIFLR